ncbi:TPA: hypothetical protein JD334_03190 [Citrobacter freundii]|nr:hypothetical protein [Citrobacter freundii]
MTLKRFKKSCSFFFSTQVKLTNYLLNLEITHIFSAREKKLLTENGVSLSDSATSANSIL